VWEKVNLFASVSFEQELEQSVESNPTKDTQIYPHFPRRTRTMTLKSETAQADKNVFEPEYRKNSEFNFYEEKNPFRMRL